MATQFRPASEAQRIAEDLISKYYPEIEESEVEIRYIFRDECGKKGGREILGTCSKVSGRAAFLAQNGKPSEDYIPPKELAFYVLEFAEDLWKGLTPEQRIALVDHELAHILIEPPENEDDGWTLKTISHDVEEFAAVIQRHGLWKPDLQWFADQTRAAMQLSLDVDS